MAPKSRNDDKEEVLTRIAIVAEDRSGAGAAHSSTWRGLTDLLLHHNRCKPKKCRQECKKSCPVVKVGGCRGRVVAVVYVCVCVCVCCRVAQMLRTHTGKQCIEVNPASKISWISEELCIGCGICVKVRSRLALDTHGGCTASGSSHHSKGRLVPLTCVRQRPLTTQRGGAASSTLAL